jgi:Ankyrin repeats (many copies)
LIKNLLVFFLILNSITSLFCSWLESPLLIFVNSCDLIIQGELTQIDQHNEKVTIENSHSLRDTAYIFFKSVLKNDDQKNLNDGYIKLLIPAKNKTTDDGFGVTNHNDIFYKIGQNGIWLLIKKGDYYTAYNYLSFQQNSNENLIKDLCTMKPSINDFLTNFYHSNYSDVKQSLDLNLIDPADSIFNYEETNPVFIAVKHRKLDIIQDILDYGFNINYRNKNNENALFIAVRRAISRYSLNKDLEIIDVLLKKNIATDIVNKHNISIYDLLDKKTNKEKILKLFQKYK